MFAIIQTLSEAWKTTKQRRAEAANKAARRAVASAFNDLYTYRFRWAKRPTPGSMHSGYAWMCPECNHIHEATDWCGLTGLQYPRCCSTSAGHRIHHGILTGAGRS